MNPLFTCACINSNMQSSYDEFKSKILKDLRLKNKTK